MRFILRNVFVLIGAVVFITSIPACHKGDTLVYSVTIPKPVLKMTMEPAHTIVASKTVVPLFGEYIYQGTFVYKDDCNKTQNIVAQMIVIKDTTGYYFQFGDICPDFRNVSYFAVFRADNYYDVPFCGRGGDVFQLDGNTLNYSGSRPYGCTDHAYGCFSGTIIKAPPPHM